MRHFFYFRLWSYVEKFVWKTKIISFLFIYKIQQTKSNVFFLDYFFFIIIIIRDLTRYNECGVSCFGPMAAGIGSRVERVLGGCPCVQEKRQQKIDGPGCFYSEGNEPEVVLYVTPLT